MSQSILRQHGRPWLLAAVLALALAILFLQRTHLENLSRLPLYDFVEYWAAGRLNASGANPYDPEAMLRLELEVGQHANDVLMWNPPWTLALVMPFGLLPCPLAHLVWLALHFVVLAWCADALWRFYGGPPEQRALAWLLAFTFMPSYIALTAGQIAPLLLLGATAFLVLSRRRQEWLAGAATVLLAIKPHLSYLFWIALLLWTLRERRLGMLAGGALTGLLATGLAVLCNPSVLSQYWHTFTSQPPAQYRSPTLGTILRLVLGPEQFRLQFLALLPGLAWFVPYWLRHRRNWAWSEHLPLLLLVSVLMTPYGGWPFDLVLLLVPVLQVAATLQRGNGAPSVWWAAAVYLTINALALAQVAHAMEYFWFIWMTPALLVGYLLLRPHSRPSPLPVRT
jgi:hypothetical protein